MTLARTPADAKRAAFVDTACELFFAQGYGATSMSSVAARVGGSKTTLWSYFPSKEALFAAVVDALIERYGQALDVAVPDAIELRDGLRRFGAATMRVAISPPVLALHRLIIGEAGRFPELGSLFHQRGPGRGEAGLAAWLETQMDRRVLRQGPPTRAARQFAQLCQAGVHQACLYGLQPFATADEIARDIEAAVDIFVRGWTA